MVYDLIHNLTKAEKRHFTLYANRQRSNPVYLELFNVIDRYKICSDHVLKERLNKSKTINNLSYHKHILLQEILNSLSTFHEKKRASFRLKNILQSIDITFHKGLMELTETLITKGLNLARKYQRIPELIELLDWKEEWARSSLVYHKLRDVQESIYKERLELIRNLEELSELNQRLDWVMIQRRSYGDVSKAYADVVWSKAENITASGEMELTGTLHARAVRWRSVSLAAFGMGDFSAARKAEEQIQELYISNWTWACEAPWRININGFNLGLSSLLLRDKSSFESDLQYIARSNAELGLGANILYKCMLINLKVRELAMNKDWAGGLALLADSSSDLGDPVLGSSLWREELNYFRSFFNYKLGHIQKSFAGLRSIIMNQSMEQYPWLKTNVRLMQMILAWEENDFELVGQLFGIVKKEQFMGRGWQRPEGRLMKLLWELSRKGLANQRGTLEQSWNSLLRRIRSEHRTYNPYFDVEDWLLQQSKTGRMAV